MSKGNQKKNIFRLGILAVAVLTLSSCNRGVGCPSNFSLGDTIEILTNTLSGIL